MCPRQNHLSEGLARSVLTVMYTVTFSLLLGLVVVVGAQDDPFPRWCGKHYQQGSPYDVPIGMFPATPHSEEPLLNFQCWPSQTPFVSSDKNGTFIIDAPLTHDVGQNFTSTTGNSSTFFVQITVDLGDGQTAVIGMREKIPVNSTGTSVPFTLAALGDPSTTPFKVTCNASFDDGTSYEATTQVKYLPENPFGGSTTGIDLFTGAMIVHNTSTGTWTPIIPFGFYTSWGDFLAPNASTLLPQIKSLGHNMVHPVPTFDDTQQLVDVIKMMNDLGLWLMYDMRWTYMNLTSVQEQSELIRQFPNLLLWYTGDEPDGTQDPLNATSNARDLLNEVDGFHPVSLVLNCQNYFFGEYTSGTDIVMEDVYPVDLHFANFSIVYNTTCDVNYGDCGCDNCKGSFRDISDRLDTFIERRRVLSRSRDLPIWGVPQAFGGAQWWPREPTGSEWLLMTTLTLNHGGLGIVPWDHNVGTTEDVKAASGVFGGALPTLTRFLTSREAVKRSVGTSVESVDVATWTLEGSGETLVLAANTEYESVSWEAKLDGAAGEVELVYRDTEDSTLTADGSGVSGTAGSVGSSAWIVHSSS